MTEVVVPITTIWDILANALDDIWFWLLSASGAFVMAIVFRFRSQRGCI